MQVYLQSLLVIMAIALTVLLVARRAACDLAIQADDYKRRAAVWAVLTLAAFLSHNYWLYALISVPVIALAGMKDSSRLGLTLFVLLAVPPVYAVIPGMGVFGQSLINMTHARWLALLLLLPAYLALRSSDGSRPMGSTAIDKFVLGFFLFRLVQEVTFTSLTNVMRIALGLCLDSLLPYYVASRALRELCDFRDALMSMVVGATILSLTAMFEFRTHWLLYSQVGDILGLTFWGGNTLNRGDLLRAQGTTGHPITLGYLMLIALAFAVYLRASIKSKYWWVLGMLALIGGLLASLSRGPWVGAVAMVLVLVATGPKLASNVFRLLAVCVLGVPMLLLTQQGQAVLDLLPFVGTVESANVDFRRHLLEVSLGVLANFPIFGSLEFFLDPELEAMRGNDGIIDIVNTYLLVALRHGLVGLFLFMGPFVLAAGGIMGCLRRIPDKEGEVHLLGRCLLAALAGAMVTIGTCSSIGVIAVVYTLLIGMSASFLGLASAAASSTACETLPLRAHQSSANAAGRVASHDTAMR